jgi:hypothetical protein
VGSAPLADCINVSKSIGADIPEPRTPEAAGEEPRTDGTEIFWNLRGRSPWTFVLVSVALTLLSIGLAVFVHRAWVIMLVNLAGPMLLLSLFGPREHGRNWGQEEQAGLLSDNWALRQLLAPRLPGPTGPCRVDNRATLIVKLMEL